LKARKALLGTFFVAVVALLLMAAAPLALSAAPAIRNFSMDRSSVASGQNITFSVETTADTQFVFALADGVRTQGSRSSGNHWTVTVSPTNSTTVTIFANTQNNETNAARIAVPVTVGAAAAAPVTPTAPAATVPTPPATLGPIAIASVTETPATASGMVQLTVVTGRESNEVWVNFDRVNNARGTGRFARATMQRQGAHYRVWVINFRPAQWATQRVEVGSNRTYNWPGASTQAVDLTLTQPYVRATTPTIQSVTPSSRTVATGSNVTFTIRTNADVENVWVRNIDGNEFNATRGTTSGTTRNWTVTFNPVRSGNVQVFANTSRTETGAASRNEHITVGAVNAQIIGTPTAHWIDGNNRIRVQVTTNEAANSVWVMDPWSNQRRFLSRTSAGANTWSVDITDGQFWGNNPWDQWDPWNNQWGNLVVHASSQTGSNAPSQDSRNISTPGWGGGNQGTGNIQNISPSGTQTVPTASGGTRTFTVTTWGTTQLWAQPFASGTGITTNVSGGEFQGGNNHRTWTVSVHVPAGTPVGAYDIWLSTHTQHHTHQGHHTIRINVVN